MARDRRATDRGVGVRREPGCGVSGSPVSGSASAEHAMRTGDIPGARNAQDCGLASQHEVARSVAGGELVGAIRNPH
jgi:hypothetical protein